MARTAALLLLGLFLVVPLAPLSAQDDAPPAPAPEKKPPAAPSAEELRESLLASLQRMGDAGYTARGTVEVREPSQGGFGRVVVAGGMGPGGPPFEGNVLASVDKEGEMVIASEKALPGFEAFRSEARDLVRVTYEKQAPDLSSLLSDLGALLDAGRLRTWLRRADLQADVDLDQQVASFTGEASRRLVPASGGVMGMMVPKILRVEVRLVLDLKARTLLEAEYRVVRSDPMAEMMKRQGGFGFGEPKDEQDEGDEREGATAVYSLRFGKGDAPPRLRSFRRAVEAMLREVK